jgi:hypothetical protein
LPQGFTLAGNLPESVAANSEATITINVDTQTAATRQGTISFSNNDSNENPFDFAVSATVNQASTASGGEIVILDGQTDIISGGTSPINFGTINIGAEFSRSFTIKNTSPTNALSLSNLALPQGFNLEGNFPESIPPNGEINLTISVDTTEAGTLQGTISFDNNDSDENPFNFGIGATVNGTSSPIRIVGSDTLERFQGDDNQVEIITPGGGADIISWTNVPPQGVTDEIIAFAPNEDQLQFASANFGNISNVTSVTVSDRFANDTDITGNNLIVFEPSLTFANVIDVDAALAVQRGTSANPVFFVYTSGVNRFLGYDPMANATGNAVSIVQLDGEMTASNLTFLS